MNSLLKRQIRKFLPKKLQSNVELESFLESINRSYTNSDEQFAMLQRATSISSDELFSANRKLQEESNSQKKIISKLENVINKLQFYDLQNDLPIENLDSLKLIDFIDNQTNEIIKINKQKDKLLRNLEHQNQELNDYAQMVSHDLKSPIQSIEALVSWIEQDYNDLFDISGKQNLKHIKDNVEKMDTLVKGILSYSRINKIKKEFFDINLDSIITKIIKNFEHLKNVSFILPKKLPTIKGDLYRLENLFFHLIDNALKFNDKKDKMVEIGFGEEAGFWKFYIKDNGTGIDEKYFEKIFVAFQKLEDDYKSPGIGLPIVKRIIEVYQGEIYLESKINVGSTFYFSIKK